ncbi:MAG TPA: BON domain-containing protein [Candidatus Binatia bacterium]|jgi:osmotically-inducible protein OsmY|nr:BON domain-containing protein [Candidatus Binatia bacterium]
MRHNIKVTQHHSNRSDDTALATAAGEAIKWLTTIPQDAISVSAHDGWLELDGKVNWRHQRITVEDVTRNLPGVKGVINSIRIQSDPVFSDVRAVLQ